MKTIAIANFKGGSGKTTTAITLAAVYAEQGKRVLLIDADPQHNSTDFYGGADEGAVTLTHVLMGLCEPYWPELLSPTGREGLSLLPADMDLLTLDLASMKAGGGSEAVKRLRGLMDVLREDNAFDLVLIDCPPSFTAASVAALSVADEVIIPTRVDAFSQSGVSELVEQIRQLILADPDRDLRWRVLITMADGTNLHREGADLLRRTMPTGCVFDRAIRDTCKVGEATFARRPVTEYAPRSTAANDYRELAMEVLKNG